MNDEIINAAVMRLKSKALEHYGLLKSTYQSATGNDTVDEMCKHAMHMVQFEGAMLTLQSYASALKEVPPVEEPAAPPEEESPPAAPISGETLAERSPTYRRSQSTAKAKPKPRAKKKKDE